MIAAIRVRGNMKVDASVEETLKMIHLKYVNNATLIPETPAYTGMLKKAKDIITWGNPTAETIAKMLAKRGKVTGENKLTDEYVSKNSSFKTIEEFAKALAQNSATLKDVKGLKQGIRLTPPSKGHRGGIKKSYKQGGALGPRGDKINELLLRMI